jgi:NADH:ubiquinone oxidoreductase subunit 5 (subunit L)/multisubunit Na+/H+ antiporter MnhA subunit
MARTSAFFERDIKKIVALSTLRQLGVMVVAISVGNWNLAFLHLIAHAFFKALLFISTGNLIHSRDSYQALKISGGLTKSIPVSYSANVICRFSLCGLPFMSAFFSKEPIIEISNETQLRGLIYLILLTGIFITIAYSVRLTLITGVQGFQGIKSSAIEENLTFTTLAISLLLPGAIFGGRVFSR